MTLDIQTFVVGPLDENTYVVQATSEARAAVVVDPGAEAPRLLEALGRLGVQVAGILLTHTHFDHVGAVAEIAEATGAEVWVPELEHHDLLTIDELMSAPDGMGAARRTGGGPTFATHGPFRPYDAEHLVRDGSTVTLAGVTFDVLGCPGHSIGHVAYVVRGQGCVFSGDVLYRGAIGRTDFPGSDHAQLLRSIDSLLDRLPPDTTFYPGHFAPGTLGEEAATNPALR